MKSIILKSLILTILLFSACSNDNETPQIKNVRVCMQLSGNECSTSLSSIPPQTSAIYSSAELSGIKGVNVQISLWAWDGVDWVLLSQTTLNNEEKNLINVTFTNQNTWASTDYEVEYLVDSDPQLDGVVAFSVR